MNYSERFTCKNGQEVIIVMHEHNYEVVVYDRSGAKIGSMEFWEIDGSLKIVWMYLDGLGQKYTRQGIGRRAVEIVTEQSGMTIWASDGDVHTEDDGSHLTGDGPAFVAKLRAEGLIAPEIFSENADMAE